MRENWVFVTDDFKQHRGIRCVFHEPEKTPSVTVRIRVISYQGLQVEPKNLPTRVCPHPLIPAHGHSLKPNFMKLGMLRKSRDNPKTETLQQSLETKFAQIG